MVLIWSGMDQDADLRFSSSGFDDLAAICELLAEESSHPEGREEFRLMAVEWRIAASGPANDNYAGQTRAAPPG